MNFYRGKVSTQCVFRYDTILLFFVFVELTGDLTRKGLYYTHLIVVYPFQEKFPPMYT